MTAMRSPIACHADLFDAVSAMSPAGAPSTPDEKRMPRCSERLLYGFLRAPGLRYDATEIDGWSISRWPTPGTVGAHWNAKLAQMPNRADAGAQQHGRRVNRTAAQDHLVGTKLHLLPANHRADADTARVLEQQLAHLRLGQHRQVVALPDRGAEIADRRRYPSVIQVRHGERIVAVLELAVLVGT